jgi:iron complex outermembrane recepter protein
MNTSLAALAAALTFATPALAGEIDDAGDSDGRPTIIVIANKQADEAERDADATPGGTDVVTHEDYADKALVSLRDALGFSPGIYLQPRFGQEVRISIRGSGISRGFHMRGLTLLQDGIPLNLADGNGDFQELEPAFFDYLEVYRGANALRFGSGTLGGAVNGVTPTGDSAGGFYARVDAGSFNTFRGLASAGFGDEDANAWIAASADSSDGDRDHARRSSMRFHGNAGFRLSDVVSTRFYASVNHINQELPGALPLDVALTEPKTGNFANDQARDINSLRLQNRTTFQLGDATLNAGAFLNAKELYHPIFQVIDQGSTDKGVFARLDWASGIFSATLGGESRWGEVNSRRFANVNGKRGALTFDAEQRARTSSLYGELRAEALPGLSLIGGGIYSDGYRRQDQTFPVTVTGKASFDDFSPKFGVLWQPAETVQVFANYSRSAEFPTFGELAQVAAFVPVRKQTAWTAEVGTRGSIGWVGWDVALYSAKLKGEMLQYNVGPDIPASTFNADRTTHKGVEAGLTLDPAEWLRIRQTWLYSDFRFDDDAQFGDNRLPVIPRHVLRTEVRFGTDALHIAPNLEWVPQGAWADYDNTTRVPDYALLGVTGGATVADGIDLFVDVRNITGKKAVGDISAVIRATPTSVIYYPVERRAFYAGVRARF